MHRIGRVAAVLSGFEGVVLMGWKPTGEPTVRKQRDKWTVRVEGIDTETGKVRPRQIGTYPSQCGLGRGSLEGDGERRPADSPRHSRLAA